MNPGDCAPGLQEQDTLRREHQALLRAYGAAQARCTQLLAAQNAEILALQSQVLRLRAAALRRETARAFALPDAARPRNALSTVLCVGTPGPQGAGQLPVVHWLGGRLLHHGDSGPLAAVDDGLNAAALEASLVAADLVICQTGCLSHGAYWRVQDHCRRTGKPCVLVSQPDAPEAAVAWGGRDASTR